MAESLLFLPPLLCTIIMVVFSTFRMAAQSFVSLVWGKLAELYVIHTNSVTVGQQEESSFLLLFSLLDLVKESICYPAFKILHILEDNNQISFWEMIIHWYFLVGLFFPFYPLINSFQFLKNHLFTAYTILKAYDISSLYSLLYLKSTLTKLTMQKIWNPWYGKFLLFTFQMQQKWYLSTLRNHSCKSIIHTEDSSFRLSNIRGYSSK